MQPTLGSHKETFDQRSEDNIRHIIIGPIVTYPKIILKT